MKKIILFSIILLPLGIHAQWYQVSTPTTENLNYIQFVDNQVGYCGGENGTLLKSTDGGTNWTIINTPFSSETIYELYFKDANNGMIRTDSNIYRTIDAGLTFQALPILTDLKDSLLDYSLNVLNLNCKDEIAILYASYKSNSNPNLIVKKSYKSIDCGINWTEIIPLHSKEGFVKILDSLNWFSMSSKYYKTHDGGISWIKSDSFLAPFPPNSNRSWQVLDSSGACIVGMVYENVIDYYPSFSNARVDRQNKGFDIVLFPFMNNNFVLYNNDDTTIVQLIESNSVLNVMGSDTIGAVLYSLFVQPSGVASACGKDGKIYKNDDITLSSKLLHKTNISIYPNPSQGKIILQYPQDLDIDKIMLSQLNGQVIREFNTDFKELDVSEVDSGHYLLQIYTSQGSITKKLMIR